MQGNKAKSLIAISDLAKKGNLKDGEGFLDPLERGDG
jgi:hypothetical protein